MRDRWGVSVSHQEKLSPMGVKAWVEHGAHKHTEGKNKESWGKGWRVDYKTLMCEDGLEADEQ